MKAPNTTQTYILGVLLLIFSYNATAQVGIGNTSPADGSLLDIESTTKGILIPRLDIADLATIDPVIVTGTGEESLLAYNTNLSSGKGFHYWDGTKWVKLAQGESDDWTTTGNVGTTPTGNFIGTTDANGFAFRTNDTERMRLTTGEATENSTDAGFLGIGTDAPTEILDCRGDVDMGGQGADADGLAETIQIRAQSADWFVGVKNAIAADDSDLFIGLTDDPDEAYFRISHDDGYISIGKDDDEPQDMLHITKDQEDITTLRIDNAKSNGGGGDLGTSVGLYQSTTEKAHFKHQNRTDRLEIAQVGGGQIDLYIDTNDIININSLGVTINGDLNVTGSFSKALGTFKIDHPLDPENMYLYHSFVESPDMLNIYNGNVITDANGNATIELPTYFSVLNKDYKYQLSAVNSFSEVMVSQEITGNTFQIKSELPNIKISWQVTGVRQDPYANKNRIIPEVEKEPSAKGKYLHPEAYNLGKEKGIYYTKN